MTASISKVQENVRDMSLNLTNYDKKLSASDLRIYETAEHVKLLEKATILA